ncbi:MAG: hypothetical protein ACD_2C00174G0010 [uncultured bacterium (gcode 4)]|uniref:Uncharacterized protein n=1 Tax=uncultured bacterium (gcode 4) TaxID=1234023 RepID=K2G2M0_9BACT|nr:MAG: hypothetical protein ACD_2C00174G0010 [uncultured bacterium (gcode 4)]
MSDIYILYSNINWLIACLIFVSYILIDWLYAKYTLEVVSLRPGQSATIGSFMHFLLAFWVINYNDNWLYLFPLAIGSWIGTYYVIKYEKIKNK